jgi:hypothetical protein
MVADGSKLIYYHNMWYQQYDQMRVGPKNSPIIWQIS